ncbi:adenosine deaminase-like protein [Bombyx mori]|uniref:Adenosine deaminase domain-containing protein n=1 Tax=Bombyx mori TaxID=7091 RepID=A0A8R1WL57_BOMMO|nr:adenosine deaminase-like protein [Bombyx mori]
MDLNFFCKELPKIELHAHLNGSLSQATMLQLQRYYVDAGISDKTNTFLDEFQIGAGDTRNLSECFQVFSIAHSLTSTSEALVMATELTLQEFQEDGCCYIELRSTPRDTQYITKKQYIDSIIRAMEKPSINLSIISKLIISINRASQLQEVEEIADIAIERHKIHPDTVVGIELSGNPAVGNFGDFIPALNRARQSGLKVTLHCGEVCNPEEVLEMLNFKPERIGHGVCIHPKYGGTEETWIALCQSKIPVEVCLTSNVNTKITPDYESHHFKELIEAGLSVVLCTDDKGVFATSLSQEYRLCAESFALTRIQVAKLSLDAAQCIFSEANIRELIIGKILKFMNDYTS